MSRSDPMPDPNLQSATDFEIDKVLRSYSNPRGLPEKWIRGYLERPKPQLALDVMRSFDENWKLHRRVSRYRWITIALTAILTSAAGEGVKVVVAAFLHR
jgi:hypothetical protein